MVIFLFEIVLMVLIAVWSQGQTESEIGVRIYPDDRVRLPCQRFTGLGVTKDQTLHFPLTKTRVGLEF